MHRSAVPVILLVIYWLAAVTTTHWPRPDLPPLVNLHLDKVAHFFIYAVLATLLIFAWRATSPVGDRREWGRPSKYLVVWVIAALYGVVDELTQPWFDRDCDVWDWVADLLGSLTAILICA